MAAGDRPRWVAEAAKRLASPLSTVAFAAIALLSVLTGTFRRHGSLLRPLAAVGAVVVLVAVELGVGDLAARSNALLGLVWAEATVPALVGLALLLGPELRRGRRGPPGRVSTGDGAVAP